MLTYKINLNGKLVSKEWAKAYLKDKRNKARSFTITFMVSNGETERIYNVSGAYAAIFLHMNTTRIFSVKGKLL